MKLKVSMKDESNNQELDQLLRGLEKAYEKMVVMKKQKNTPLVVSENGKVKLIPPEDIPPTTTYRR